MKKIAVLVDSWARGAAFGDKYFDRLRKSGELAIFDRDDFSDREHVLSFVKGADIIVTSWGSPKIDAEILSACPDLLAVIHAAGSVKPLLSDEFIEKKIRITNSAVAIGEGVAESALAFLISACKGFYKLNEDTASGLWNENVPTTVTDFYDITIGVISGGMVGRHLVKLLKSFHVDILMYDPILSAEEIAAIGAEKVELDELLKRSDAVTVHAPAIPATENMLNKDNLCLLRDGAVLVNTARGSIINERDLIEELKKGRIFACLDVTEPEPPTADNELRTLKNVVLTPHIAGTNTNGLKRIALHVCEEVERLLRGERMKAEVDLNNLSKLA